MPTTTEELLARHTRLLDSHEQLARRVEALERGRTCPPAPAPPRTAGDEVAERLDEECFLTCYAARHCVRALVNAAVEKAQADQRAACERAVERVMKSEGFSADT